MKKLILVAGVVILIICGMENIIAIILRSNCRNYPPIGKASGSSRIGLPSNATGFTTPTKVRKPSASPMNGLSLWNNRRFHRRPRTSERLHYISTATASFPTTRIPANQNYRSALPTAV